MAVADANLILAFVRVGDLVQLTPLAQRLRSAHPDAPVAVCVLPEFVSAAGLMGGVDEIIPIDRDSLLRLSLRSDLTLKSMLGEAEAILAPLLSRRFRIAINMTHTHVSAMLMSLVQAADKRGPVMTPEGQRRVPDPWMRFLHAYIAEKTCCPFNLVDLCAQTAGPEGGKGPFPLAIRIPADAGRWAEDFLARECPGGGPLVAVHMGASDSHKMWTPASFVLACRAIRERVGNARLLLVGGGGAEREVAERALACIDAPGSAVAAGKTDLAQLAGLLERCDLAITNDTGPMHVAAAAGTRVLSVALGPIHYSNTAPYGEGHVVVQSRAACAPCSFHVRCVNPECKEMIPPQAVADAAVRMLSGDPLAERSIPDAGAFATCDVYATCWGEDGMLDYRPLVDRPPDLRTRLVRAYRKIWPASLGDTGAMPGERFVLPAAGDGLVAVLRKLESLALEGRNAGGDLAKLGRNPRHRAQLEAGLETIRRSGKSIRELGQAVPEVNSLCTMFALEEENMEAGGLEEASAENARIYGKLLRRTRSLAYLLANGEDAGSDRHEGSG